PRVEMDDRDGVGLSMSSNSNNCAPVLLANTLKLAPGDKSLSQREGFALVLEGLGRHGIRCALAILAEHWFCSRARCCWLLVPALMQVNVARWLNCIPPKPDLGGTDELDDDWISIDQRLRFR